MKYRLANFLLCLSILTIAPPVLAGPQHWGFGMEYLAVIEKVAGTARLVVYEAPVRAKDAVWISRWVDDSELYKDVLLGCMAVGNFWPGDFGKDYIAVITGNGERSVLRILEPPEVFGTMPWRVVSSSPIYGRPVAITAGDLRGEKKDKLILIFRHKRGFSAQILSPPAEPNEKWQTISGHGFELPRNYKEINGIACGDFWEREKDFLAITYVANDQTRADFYTFDVSYQYHLLIRDVSGNLPRTTPHGFVSADYVKDGFDTMTFLPADPNKPLEVRSAVAIRADHDIGSLYTSRALSGQWMPGVGGRKSMLNMRGRREKTSGRSTIVAAAAGRLFGYVDCNLDKAQREKNGYDPRPDAEIAFSHRFPTPPRSKGAPQYGWPRKGETFGYEINLKNNGQVEIPPGSAKLRVWINTPYRNADTHPLTRNKPHYVLDVAEALPPFDPLKPDYVKLKVTSKWPYDLIPVGPGIPWKKINLLDVGERWLVISMQCEGDNNLRNNRYEAAIHAWTFHPMLRSTKSLADRFPTVKGDPPSKEYLSRKLADALTCMLERTRTTKNEDVLRRVFFDGYEIGWPNDRPTPAERQKAWEAVQTYYEGWRELDGWWGENQRWERFKWEDGAAELHEAGHLYHPIGDLYQYYLHPVWTSGAKMADGTPVQLATNCWGPDSFSTNHAVIGYPTGEYMRRFLVGTKGWGLTWYHHAPEKIYIRVLDRDGEPVPGARVTLWPYGRSNPLASGTTGSDGRWDTGHPKKPPQITDKGIKRYFGYLMDAFAQIVTVELPGYQDASVWGMEDQTSYGKYTLFYHGILNEKEWTWDFRTNYKAEAPKPSFSVEAAIKGRKVQLVIRGRKGALYRLYRRWGPTYNRTIVGQHQAPGERLVINQDMSEPDSHSAGRFRAIYEVTEIADGVESLPKAVQCTGLANVSGISAQSDGKLIVTSNTGIANPFAVLCDGTVPYVEYFYHFRFGHTALKIVESRKTPGKYYATLVFSDMKPDYRFDVINPLPEGRAGYDVRNHIGGFDSENATHDEPYKLPFKHPERHAGKINPGDSVRSGQSAAAVLDVQDGALILDRPIFAKDRTWGHFSADRLAGKPGSNPKMRELKDARGLAAMLLNGREYVIIADTGNNRVVVWDENTKYITHVENEGLNPAAITAHPTVPGAFFVLDRHADRKSKLYLFTFDGKSISPVPGYPLDLNVGDAAACREMGLAAAARPDQSILVAVTDAQRNEVHELHLRDGEILAARKHNTAIGTYAGDPRLDMPSDVAYVLEANALRLYAVDGRDRVVRLR